MSGLLLKIRMFVSSYAPLFLILAIRFDDRWLQAACAAIAALGVLTLSLLLHAMKGKNKTPFSIVAVADQGTEVAGYLATYLLPFLTISEPALNDLVAYGLFLVVAGIVYVQSDMVQINPLLYVMGYRVSGITTSDGWNGYLIARHRPREEQTLLVSRFINTLALERTNGEEMASRVR